MVVFIKKAAASAAFFLLLLPALLTLLLFPFDKFDFGYAADPSAYVPVGRSPLPADQSVPFFFQDQNGGYQLSGIVLLSGYVKPSALGQIFQFHSTGNTVSACHPENIPFTFILLPAGCRENLLEAVSLPGFTGHFAQLQDRILVLLLPYHFETEVSNGLAAFEPVPIEQDPIARLEAERLVRPFTSFF